MFIFKISKNQLGFTLLEILIAVFIFSILSIILATTLHTILDHQIRAEQNTDSFSEIQIAMLLLSRDLEQLIDRPIINNSDQLEPALIGTSQTITLTHTGLSNPQNQLLRSSLQRTQYQLIDGQLIRKTWSVLDSAPTTQSIQRILLTHVTHFHITYFDNNLHPQPEWPVKDQAQSIFPHTIRISLTLKQWGRIEQTYVITE